MTSSGDDYDLIVVNHTDTLSFIKGELLYPNGDMTKEKGIDVDSIIMGNLKDRGKLGDTLYTIPVNTDTRIMLVNKDLFDKYNLAVPTTMDEMLATGKVISEANQGDCVFTDEMCTNRVCRWTRSMRTARKTEERPREAGDRFYRLRRYPCRRIQAGFYRPGTLPGSLGRTDRGRA